MTTPKQSLKYKAAKTLRKTVRVPVHDSANVVQGPKSALSADRIRAVKQRMHWSLDMRRQWWRQYPAVEMPMLPLPRTYVTSKDIPQAKIQAIEAMQEFGVVVEACRASGMGRYQLGTLISKKTPDGEFRSDMLRARKECQERLEGAFIQRGMQRGGDLAGIFYLKHSLPKYREISRIELTGKDGAPIHALDAAKAEMLERLDKLVKLAAESTGSGGSAGSGGSGSRKGLEGRQEIVLEGSGPRQGLALTKGSASAEVRRAGRRKEA